MYGIVVHGGAGGTSPEAEEGCRQAAEVGMEILQQERDALDAAVAAVVWMENSGIFNAGVGSVLRIDGTIEMDAALITSQGIQGTVGAVSGVQNPILLAEEVTRSNMRSISGAGATSFAMERGLKFHPGPTERAYQRLESLKEEVRASLAAGEIPPGWAEGELQEFVGADRASYPVSAAQHDTVGAVVFDKQGVIALAASTGGSGLMRSGRDGDVPVRGAGFQIGEKFGVLATGVGETIIDQQGAERVALLLRMNFAPQQACGAALTFFSSDTVVGFIALTRDAIGVAANCPMASHSIMEE